MRANFILTAHLMAWICAFILSGMRRYLLQNCEAGQQGEGPLEN